MKRLRFWCCLLLLLSLHSSWVWASDPPTIAIVLKSMQNEFFVQMADGAEAYATAHSDQLRLTVEGVKAETDVSGQELIIRRLLAQKIDALIIVPTDSIAMLPVLMQAIASGVLVINMDNKLDDRALALEGVNIPFVGPSNFAVSAQCWRVCGQKVACRESGRFD